MSSLLDMFPQLPFSEWISNFIDWITANFNVLFDSLNSVGTSSMEWMTRMLMLIPPLAFIIIVMLVAYFVSNRKMAYQFSLVLGYYIFTTRTYGVI